MAGTTSAASPSSAEVFWKIDYYDFTLTRRSEDPADEAVTTRALTIVWPASTEAGGDEGTNVLEGAALAPLYAQGDLDGLCGRARRDAINDVLMAPVRSLTAADRTALMTTGAAYLAKRGLLIEAIANGMQPVVQYGSTCKLAK